MEKALLSFVVKAADEGVITGIASTPTIDTQGDVLDPLGAHFELPLPLLSEHDPAQPLGMVEQAEVTPEGIKVTCRIAKDASERVKAAWAQIKSGLNGLSVGFVPMQMNTTTTGRHFQQWQWCELSVVGNPANPQAAITFVKSNPQPLKESKPMNIQEQIQQAETKKAALVQSNATLVTKSADMTAEDAAAYDATKAEIEKIDKHLARLQETERNLAATAKPLPQVTDAETGSKARQGSITVKSNLPQGTGFVRYAAALARSKGNLMQAAEIAKSYQDTPEVERVLKAAVAAGTTTDSAWAAPLVEYTTLTSEFIELLRPQTIMGQIEGFRRVPFDTRIQSQITPSSVNWVGEGKLKPVSKLGFGTLTLGSSKLSGIVAITEELARKSTPSAEALISQDLRASMAEFLDKAFIDPTKAAVDGVSPASITHGVTAITPSGTDVAAVKKDVQAAFSKFLNANLTPAGAYWVMNPVRALALSMMSNELGNAAFPDINMNGGTFYGLPVILSLTAGDNIYLFTPSEVLLADDGGLTLDASSEASLLLSDDPENDKATQSMVSLWQAGMIGFKADRWINWRVRRPEAVVLIKNAKYTA